MVNYSFKGIFGPDALPSYFSVPNLTFWLTLSIQEPTTVLFYVEGSWFLTDAQMNLVVGNPGLINITDSVWMVFFNTAVGGGFNVTRPHTLNWALQNYDGFELLTANPVQLYTNDELNPVLALSSTGTVITTASTSLVEYADGTVSQLVGPNYPLSITEVPDNTLGTMYNGPVNTYLLDRITQEATLRAASRITGSTVTTSAARDAAAQKQSDERELAYQRTLRQGG